MRAVRFVALGDSLTEGVGDPAGDGWRGWAALLAASLAEAAEAAEGVEAVPVVEGRRAGGAVPVVEDVEGVEAVPVVEGRRAGGAVPAVEGRRAVAAVEFSNLAVSGAQTRDVLERQTPAALLLRPDLASVVVGVNDTLRHTFDIHAVAADLDRVYATLTARGATLLTACLPDPGAMLGLPGALARPLARRQRAVNTVVHALSDRYGAVHLHAADGDWIADRALWSADRLHPGERGHRQFAVRFHALLAEAGHVTGEPPSPEPEFPGPTRTASLWWLATAGTGWVARRCRDLLPQLLRLAADELHHHARGTGARLDLRASAAVSAALAALPGDGFDGAGVQRRRTGTNRTGVPGTACAAAGRSAARTTAITG
ncbi:SGNH/GDSL hydrolase family protein [Streptomyces sp. NPDC048514]|uniref:SGNH/GDSL hydrolase family protein n=1 Tax=Streptomyces sp. NPDC048514 TaxID=3365564 RepID=UPI0037238B01